MFVLKNKGGEGGTVINERSKTNVLFVFSTTKKEKKQVSLLFDTGNIKGHKVEKNTFSQKLYLG